MVTKTKIGCDIVYIKRIEKLLLQDKFIERIFHETECKYCEKKVKKSSSYAARFAAKEAFAKAIGSGLYHEGVGPRDIWIENDASGKPILRVSEKLEEKLKVYHIKSWDVSLSHHEDYAMAVVVVSME